MDGGVQGREKDAAAFYFFIDTSGRIGSRRSTCDCVLFHLIHFDVFRRFRLLLNVHTHSARVGGWLGIGIKDYTHKKKKRRIGRVGFFYIFSSRILDPAEQPRIVNFV
jgi:hypothetical protein